MPFSKVVALSCDHLTSGEHLDTEQQSLRVNPELRRETSGNTDVVDVTYVVHALAYELSSTLGIVDVASL